MLLTASIQQLGQSESCAGLSVSGRHIPDCDRDSSLGKLHLRREPGQQRRFTVQDQPRYRRTCGSHATYSGRIESFGNRTQHGRRSAVRRQSDGKFRFCLHGQLERWHFDRGRGVAIRHRTSACSSHGDAIGQISLRGQFKSSGGVRLLCYLRNGQPDFGCRIAVHRGQRTEFDGGGPNGTLSLRDEFHFQHGFGDEHRFDQWRADVRHWILHSPPAPARSQLRSIRREKFCM